MTEIEVYTTPSCPYCTKLKNWLGEQDIDYEAFDLSQNKEKAQELIQKTGQRGVPQTLIKDGDEEKAVIGFQPDKIKAEI
ncbi:glutaredoxin YruB-family protein [Candidatus Haloredivivus sp. G17]|jgi:glutaredoxin-like YruB-family protein|nr:glutaredoxin YruB-family protein [Candidatus Haloredivivus sp. G17]